MPVVHELFGYRLDDKTEAAKKCRRKAFCPFMGEACDGGGNRVMSKVSLKEDASLRSHFAGVGAEVHCGICSLAKPTGEWVICPRRILCFKDGAGQDAALGKLMGLAGWEAPAQLAVWREVPMHTKGEYGQEFVYTFDYILRRVQNGSPSGDPLIVEIMTCSTSGGDRKKGTDIQSAFCNAVRGEAHSSPNVNQRQVWARMASQLIVKSVAANKWGGRAVWVIQDRLAEYIANTTGLRLNELRSDNLDEVNLLAFKYGDNDKKDGLREMRDADLYAGPIDSGGSNRPCFLDIIKPGFTPEISVLESTLKKKKYDILDWRA